MIRPFHHGLFSLILIATIAACEGGGSATADATGGATDTVAGPTDAPAVTPDTGVVTPDTGVTAPDTGVTAPDTATTGPDVAPTGPDASPADTGTPACEPLCGDRVCGPDPRCGRTCGTCQPEELCDPAGLCVTACTPDCAGRFCGFDPVCGFSCGDCPDGYVCLNGRCESDACGPQCGGRVCGPDPVCGASCGSCSAESHCEDGACAPNCAAGLTECGGECVDTTEDPRYCGSCQRACQPGEVCVLSDCEAPADCRVNESCSGFTYCDLATGECRPGCAFDDQCGENEACVLAAHECDCAAGFHRCESRCVADAAPAHCGDRCDPCPGDPNGAATCTNDTCGMRCDAGHRLCDGRCAACPTAGATAFACDADRCVATACTPGGRLLSVDGRCLAITSEIVDDTGVHCRLQVDSTGRPHMVYGQVGNFDWLTERRLMYATRGPTGWTTTQVRSADSAYPGFVLDADDVPHVSFLRRPHGGTHYSTLEDGAWDNEIVEDPPVDVRGETAIALTAAGQPVVLWPYDYDYIRLSRRAPDGTWTHEMITPAAESGGTDGADLVVADDGRGHAVYRQDRAVYYRELGLPGSHGEPVLLAGADEWPDSPRVALDADGVVHVVFVVSEPDDAIVHAVRSGGTWRRTNPPLDDDAHTLALAIDDQGRPHVAWFYGGLSYAILVDGAWRVSELAWGMGNLTSGDEGPDLSLALDGEGQPHICVRDESEEKLLYFTTAD